MSTTFDLDAAWSLHPQVALRPEPFGALLYHFGTRRLSFVKDPALTTAVRTLGEHPSARSAVAAAGLPAGREGGRGAATPCSPEVLAALGRLAATAMIVRRGS